MSRSSYLLLALATLVHLTLLVSWRQGFLVPLFFDATVLSGGRGLDFYAVYQAGSNILHGIDVYELDPAIIPASAPYFSPFRYLPIMGYLLGAALNLLDWLNAYRLWVVITEATLMGCIYLTWRWVPDRDLFARLAAMWLSFSPYYLELFMGQFSFVQGALVFFIMAQILRRGKPDRRFDAAWFASLLWKINTVLFIPVLMRLRRFSTLVWAGVLVAVTTVPYFVLYPQHFGDFLRGNLGETVAGHQLGNLGFRQFVFEALTTVWPNLSAVAHQWTQASVVATVLGLALGLTLFDSGLDVIDHLSLWWTAFFLASPQVWEHHYVMLLPVLVVAYGRTRSPFVAILFVLLALPTPFYFTGLSQAVALDHRVRWLPLDPAWRGLLQHASKSIPTLLLFGYLATGIARRILPSLGAMLSHARHGLLGRVGL
jgi:hypothetical protein